MANRSEIKGAVPVLAMPFDDDGAIDDDSLRREIDFCLEAGSQALCFGMGSESNQLTDAERAHVWTLAARHLNGAVPLVVATSHPSREGTIALTRLALECGADCAMVNPQPRAGERMVSLFRDLSERVGLPIMIQDLGAANTVDLLLRAAREAPQVVAAKIESAGAPLKIGRYVATLREAGLLAGSEDGQGGQGGRVTVLGGSGGTWLPEELEAGSVGTMPHPAIIDAYRMVCDRQAAGDAAGAAELHFQLIAPLLRAAVLGGQGEGDGGGTLVWVHKALLVRAGVIHSTYCRANNTPAAEAVMERVWRHVEQSGLLVARRAGAR